MKRLNLFGAGTRAAALTALALILTAASAYAAPPAPSIVHYKTMNNQAVAGGGANAPDNCSWTVVTVNVNDTMQLAGSTAPGAPTAFVTYSYFNWCNQTSLNAFQWAMPIPAGAFSMTGSTATLRPITVPANDQTFAPHTLTISATWNLMPSTALHSHWTWGQTGPGTTYQSDGTGTSFQGTATISASVDGGSVSSYPANFFCWAASNTSGSVTVFH